MEDIAEFLTRSKLFQGLSPEAIRKYIVSRGTVADYPKGSHIILPQQQITTLKILIRGKVNILYYDTDGSCSLTAAELPPRVLALDLVATRTRLSPYYAVAAEPTTVFSFPADIILKPGEIPEQERQLLLEQLLIMLSNLHLQKEKRLVVLSKSGLRDRIMTYLSLQAQQRNTLHFTIPFSREEMAAYLCVNRSALSHELSLMQQEGLIRFSKNSFTLLNSEPADRVFEP